MTRSAAISAFALTVVFEPALAQISPAKLDAISIPDEAETAIGTIEFYDGVPTDATIATGHDNLDCMRGIKVFLDDVGAVSMYRVRHGLADAGAEGANRIALVKQLMASKTRVVTADTSTLCACTFTDLAKDGPAVIETPPGMLSFLDEAWQRFVGNMGVPGPDKRKGGKYLMVPSDHDGDVPEGIFLPKPPMNRNFMFLRGSITDGLKPAFENIASNLRVYQLEDAADPAATNFVSMSNNAFSTVFASDFSFFENLDRNIREEPIDAISLELRGEVTATGLVEGQPYAPDARMKTLRTEAAALGDTTARAISHHQRIAGVQIRPDDANCVWAVAFADPNPSFGSDGTMGLNARVLHYFDASGGTPFLAITNAGRGLGLRGCVPRCQEARLRKGEGRPAAPAAGLAPQRFLDRHALRQSDPLAAPDGVGGPDLRQPGQGHDGERRGLL